MADSAAAEDVAQEAVLSAITNLRSFDRGRPFRPWLFRIVTNRALDHVRARERRAEVGLDSVPERGEASVAGGLSPELKAALLSLEPRDRAVVVLRHVAGFSSVEIGEVLNLTDGTARSILKRSLERLRSSLGEEASG